MRRVTREAQRSRVTLASSAVLFTVAAFRGNDIAVYALIGVRFRPTRNVESCEG